MARTTKNIWHFIAIKSNLQEIVNFANFIQEISDSNLETGRIDDFDPLTIDFGSEFLQVLGIWQFCIFSLSPWRLYTRNLQCICKDWSSLATQTISSLFLLASNCKRSVIQWNRGWLELAGKIFVGNFRYCN